WQTISPSASTDDNAPNHWTGPRVLRRRIEVPETIHGYSARNARVKLDLNIGSDREMVLTVFSNGSIVFRGSGEMQQPILLAEIAQPGQKFLIAVRVDAANIDTALFRGRLLIEPTADRPDPALLRDEILAARPLIAAYADGRSEREQAVHAAVKMIDFAPLDHGDQRGFDQSLRNAQAKLETLNSWMK